MPDGTWWRSESFDRYLKHQEDRLKKNENVLLSDITSLVKLAFATDSAKHEAVMKLQDTVMENQMGDVVPFDVADPSPNHVEAHAAFHDPALGGDGSHSVPGLEENEEEAFLDSALSGGTVSFAC